MTAADKHTTHPAHAAVWDLLPWYHNDGLTPSQRAEVERHLRECLVCARELRLLRQLDTALASPALESASAQGFARLSAAIDARQRSWHQRLRHWLSVALAPAPMLATVALVAFGVLLVWNIERGDDSVGASAEKQFQTFGKHDSHESLLASALLRVVLKDSQDAAARQAWLGEHDAELVDGPSDIGVMTVRVKLGARSVTKVIDDMRAEADTLFVEPLRSTGTRPDRRR
jgi:anti-sigma factor RsiW